VSHFIYIPDLLPHQQPLTHTMPKIGPKLASKTAQVSSPTAQARTSPAPAPPNPKQPSSSLPSATSSPSVAASEPAWLTSVALKAVHEHTFATQRAKKAADRAKGKAPPRKAPGHSSSSPSSNASTASPMRTAEMTSVWAEIWDARKTITAEDLEWPELSTTPLSASQRSTEYALRPTQAREVPLSALVRPVNVRGAKAKAKGAC
jgi:hypothetical protein